MALLIFYLLQCISSSFSLFSLFLPLTQLPLTATFSFSSSSALYCHSSSVSFSFPLPHGTTSVWECCTCPVEKDSDKQCDEKPGSSFTSPCLVSIYVPTPEHRVVCAVSLWTSQISKAVKRIHCVVSFFSCSETFPAGKSKKSTGLNNDINEC